MPRSSVRAASAEVDESVAFSTQNLRHVAASHSQPPGVVPSSRPGFAGGEGSGLVDIGALSSIAAQQAGNASRPPMPQPSGNYVRVESIAPAPASRRSAALPIVVFAGFSMIAAAAFAAIWITRTPATVATPTPVPAPAPAVPVAVASAAQPIAQPPVAEAPAAPAVPPTAAAEVAQPVEVAKAPDESPAPAVAKAEPEVSPEVAVGKRASKRTARSARTAAEDKKDVEPDESETKGKAKDKEKAAPPSLDDVMLAGKDEAKDETEEAPPAPDEPKAAKASSGDIDDLLGGDKAAKAPEKDRSFDDLLDGAVVKKSAPAAEVLPESPSRDQVLSAMRGIESDVKGCDATGELSGTTVQLQIQVSGSSGRVTSANAIGASGPVAACIAKAAKAAEFPRFSKPTFAVKFPYRFN